MVRVFDELLKEMCRRIAEPFAEAEAGAELRADPQLADVVAHPRATAPIVVEAELSLVARMFSSTCLIEGYHQTPSFELVLECMRKQLVLHHREALAARSSNLDVPTLWVLSAGRPERALRELGMVAAENWPAGVYRGPLPGVPMFIVALNELPRAPETLLWRVLGAGRVLEAAIQELKEKPKASAVHRVALEVMLRLNFEVVARRNKGEPVEDEKEWTMVTTNWLESYEGQLIQTARLEGEAKGKAEGKAEGEAKAILAVLSARGLPITDEQRDRILACTDIARLDAMLSLAVSSKSVAEILH